MGVVVPWGSPGWKYASFPIGDTTDRSGVDYDDSGWAEGQAPFGTGVVPGSPGEYSASPYRTLVPDTVLWARRWVKNARMVEFGIGGDAKAYWNGTLLQAYHGGPVGVGNEIPNGYNGFEEVAETYGEDLLAIRSEHYDATVLGGTAPFPVWIDGQIRTRGQLKVLARDGVTWKVAGRWPMWYDQQATVRVWAPGSDKVFWLADFEYPDDPDWPEIGHCWLKVDIGGNEWVRP